MAHTTKTFLAGILALLIGINVASGGLLSASMPMRAQAVSVVPDEPTQTAADTDNAYNWAGYVAQSGTYTEVSGTWIVPTVTNPSGNGADATWVGIGGVQTHDLIQAGTEAVPNQSGGLEYQAWYELLPGSSHAVPLPVSPGDSVSISITQQSGSQWVINFRDNTTGGTYTENATYNSSLSSAEWIEEMPVGVGQQISLDDFGTVDFTAGFAIKNGQGDTIAGAGATALTMENAEHESIAVPSVLGSDGSSFSVTRTDADSSPLQIGHPSVRAISETGIPTSSITTGQGAGVPQRIIVSRSSSGRYGSGRMRIITLHLQF